MNLKFLRSDLVKGTGCLINNNNNNNNNNNFIDNLIQKVKTRLIY